MTKQETNSKNTMPVELSPSDLLLYNLIQNYKQVAEVYKIQTKYAKAYREAKAYLNNKGIRFKRVKIVGPYLGPEKTVYKEYES
jgi:hypothetical protein